MFNDRLARFPSPTWPAIGLLWMSRLITWIFGVLAIGAFAVCFGSMWLSALHSLINFIPRAIHTGLAALVHDELSDGTLALRIASVTTLGTWLWNGYGLWKWAPKKAQLNESVESDLAQHDGHINRIWSKNAESARTFFSSDNAARSDLKGVPFHLPPANIFFFHTLHLGFIALAVMFS
jgi:hypothetical protein